MNNKGIRFGEGNLRSVQNDTYCYLTWSLPSRTTCPYSTEMCRDKCFAKKNERFKNVRDSRNKNLEATKQDNFIGIVIETIDKYLSKKKCLNKLVIVRIHASGDFYNEEYLEKWIHIANNYKNDSRIQFQSYTKSIELLKDKNLNDINIHFVYSQWDDTDIKDAEVAKKLNLPIFYATSRENVEEYRASGGYCCPKTSDGKCKECYKNNHKLILVSYH